MALCLVAACSGSGGPGRNPPSATSDGSVSPPGPTLTNEQLISEACKSGAGIVLSLTASEVACQATLTKTGDIFSACKPGFGPCTSNPLPPQACAALPGGFYVGAARASQLHIPPTTALTCTWGGPQADVNQRFLMGCGTTAKTVYDSPVACNGFTRALLCRNGSAEGPTTWDCFIGSVPGDVDFADVKNTGEGGVLCCSEGG